jgi:hypothetical protein
LEPGTDGTEYAHYVIEGVLPEQTIPSVGTLLADSETGWTNTSWGTNGASHTTNITADSSAVVELFTGTTIAGATPVCTINGAGPECDIATSFVSSQDPWGGNIFPTTCSGRTTFPYVSCPAWAMTVAFTYDASAAGTSTEIVEFSGNTTGDWRNVFRTGLYMGSDGLRYQYGDHYNSLLWAPPAGTLVDGERYTMTMVYGGTLTGTASGSIEDYYDAFTIEMFQG